MELVPGTEVERYVVVSRIGAGRMSTTYAVRHRILDTRHALVVPNHRKRGFLRQLVNGARIQAGLRHPGVVSATDVIDVDGLPALVIDYVDGPSLSRLVRFHQLDDERIDQLAAGLIDAIAFLHANSIVHRHLKPKNVLVDMRRGKDFARISDFTLATVLGSTTVVRRRAKPRVFGTPSYMSPEQTLDSEAVDHRADLWSLGCVLYYLASGAEVFDAPDAEVTFQQVRAGEYVPLRARKPGLPERWSAAIDATLVVDEDARVPSASALRHLWFEGETPPEARPRTAPIGKVTLVFTDIQGSTMLWDLHEDVARHSLRAHDAVMRAALHEHGGYEVKTEGDAFMVAFHHPTQALRFCLEVQRQLYFHPWSTRLLDQPQAAVEPGFRGLRVRMGVHVGQPECRVHRDRVDYFGTMVNRAARVAHAGHGGQILVSAEAWREGRHDLEDAIVVKPLGAYRLRGLSGTQDIVEILPQELDKRRFPPLRSQPA